MLASPTDNIFHILSWHPLAEKHVHQVLRVWHSFPQVLLVFGKEDAQCDALSKAADKAGFKVTLAKSAEAAVESFVTHQQELVIIDCRHSIYFDHDKLCR